MEGAAKVHSFSVQEMRVESEDKIDTGRAKEHSVSSQTPQVTRESHKK